MSFAPKGFMPILSRKPALYIPIAILDQYWARQNHGQTLERLAERGGLSPDEMVANIMRRAWRPMKEDEAMLLIFNHCWICAEETIDWSNR